MPVFFVEDTEGIIGEPQSKFFLLRLKAWLNENLNPSGAVCHTGADTCFNETRLKIKEWYDKAFIKKRA